MKLFPIYIDGEVAMKEVTDLFENGGFHVRIVGNTVVAKKIPRSLAKAESPPAPAAGRRLRAAT